MTRRILWPGLAMIGHPSSADIGMPKPFLDFRDVWRRDPAGWWPPRKDWPIERKREYFDWAKKVIDQVRGTNPKLERRFDQLYRKRP